MTTLLLCSCGGGEEQPPRTAVGQYTPGSNQPQGYGGQAPVAGAAGAAGQAAPGPIGPVPSDPSTLQGIISGFLAGGAAALGAVTGGELGPIEQGIKQKATTEAKGMTPVGELMSAKLQQGAHASGSLTMQPGECYTVLGFGGLGVFEYQINLMTAPPLPPQVLAQGTTGKSDPSLGAEGQCIQTPSPLPMMVKVDMHVVKGQGLVGAQAYKK